MLLSFPLFCVEYNLTDLFLTFSLPQKQLKKDDQMMCARERN